MPYLSVFAFALLFSIPMFAQDKAVEVSLKLSPAGSFQATTNRIGGAAIKQGNGYSAAKVVVDLNSLVTGMALRDQHMKEKYLETKKFPTAEVTAARGEGGKGTGKLKIRGIEKPISGTYELIEGGKKIRATFPIKLSDFGITGIRYMGVGVKDEATVKVTVPTRDAGAAPPAAPKK